MLSHPKTSDRVDRRSRDDDDRKKGDKPDASAEFIQELAESGSASDLGTVNAAADAVEGKEGDAVRHKPKRDKT